MAPNFFSSALAYMLCSTASAAVLDESDEAQAHPVLAWHPPQPHSTWSSMIFDCYKKGQDEHALRLYHLAAKDKTAGLHQQQQDTGYVFVAVLKACANSGALAQGKRIHADIRAHGLEANVFVASTLIHLYTKCGCIQDAYKLFSTLPAKDVVLWNSMMAGYVEAGYPEEAIQLFHHMQQQQGMQPNRASFLSVLKACSDATAMEQGSLIQSAIQNSCWHSDLFVSNTLIDMYAKCGSVQKAQRVFDSLVNRDQVSWSTMMAAYAEQGYHLEALHCFQQMQRQGVRPNKVILLITLKACTSMAALAQGRLLHGLVLNSGFASDVFIASSLIDMYAKCGGLEDAQRVFDGLPAKDVVCWTALIAGNAQHGCQQDALELFLEMQRQGLSPNAVTFVSVLKACCSMAALEQGKLVHALIVASELEADTSVANALIYLYAKCGSFEDASSVFTRLVNKDIVSWNAMIAGYVHHGLGYRALDIFRQMQLSTVPADKVTLVTVLKACATVAALSQGKLVHGLVRDLGFTSDIVVGSVLVDMYAKCGSVEDAETVFQRLPKTNLVSCNAMIAGYAQHGRGHEALALFATMQEQGVEPDSITFLCLLFACSHAGLVEQGTGLFTCMTQEFGIHPHLDHYACMVNLLGRAGYLHEAECLISSLPCPPDAVLWMSLLGACRTHGNVQLGERSFQCVLHMDAANASAYALMSRTYTQAGRPDDAAEMTRQMLKLGATKKEPGCTWIELDREVYTFVVEDKHQRDRKLLYATLRILSDAVQRIAQLHG